MNGTAAQEEGSWDWGLKRPGSCFSHSRGIGGENEPRLKGAWLCVPLLGKWLWLSEKLDLGSGRMASVFEAGRGLRRRRGLSTFILQRELQTQKHSREEQGHLSCLPWSRARAGQRE